MLALMNHCPLSTSIVLTPWQHQLTQSRLAAGTNCQHISECLCISWRRQFELGPAAVAWYSIHMLTYQKVWAKKQWFLFSSPMVRVTGWRLLHNCKAKDRQITVQKTPAHYSIHLESVTLIKMFCCQDLHQVMKQSRRDHLKQTD